MLRLGQPRRDGVRGSLRLPLGPQAEQAPLLRLWRASLPRAASGQDGDAHPVRGTAAAPGLAQAGWRGEADPVVVRQRVEDAAVAFRPRLTGAKRTPRRRL